jgi:hypothetical protein
VKAVRSLIKNGTEGEFEIDLDQSMPAAVF